MSSLATRVGVIADRPAPTVNLLAGQLYFGRRIGQVRTLLGSCVSITLWSPKHRLGGMCHFLLPTRTRRAGDALDGRFGDEAVAMLVDALGRAGTGPRDYQAHLYGGADTMPDRAGVKLNIGERNIELGWSLIDQHGFDLVNVDVGDHVPRNVSLTLQDGTVEVRRGVPTNAAH